MAKRRVIATTSELIRPKQMLKPLEAAEADEEVEEEDGEHRQEVWEGLIESYNPDEANEEGQEGDDLFDDYQDKGLSQEMVAEKEEEQGREPKTLKSPVKVTKAEREKHECTHAPFQSWCKYCVKARGVNKAHKKKKGKGIENEDLEKVPRVSMDYWFMSKKDEAAKTNPLIVMVNESSTERYARATGRKGVGQENEMM